MTYRRMLGIDPTDTSLHWGTRIPPQTGTLVKPPEPPSGTVGTMEKSATVGEVQELLRSHGYCVRRDGIYGSETRSALERFAAFKGVAASFRSSTGTRAIAVANPLWNALTSRPRTGVSCPSGGGTAPPPPVVDEELDLTLDDRRPFLDTMREVPWWAWALIAAAMGFTGWRVYVARKRRRAARAALAPNRHRGRSTRRNATRRRNRRRARRNPRGGMRRELYGSITKGKKKWAVSWRLDGRDNVRHFKQRKDAERWHRFLLRTQGNASNIKLFDADLIDRMFKNPTYRRRHYALPSLRRI